MACMQVLSSFTDAVAFVSHAAVICKGHIGQSVGSMAIKMLFEVKPSAAGLDMQCSTMQACC